MAKQVKKIVFHREIVWADDAELVGQAFFVVNRAGKVIKDLNAPVKEVVKERLATKQEIEECDVVN